MSYAALLSPVDSQQVLKPAPPPPPSGIRDPRLWPFLSWSIWNLPIGALARYVFAGIRPATQMAFFCDADILCMDSNAPATPVNLNGDDWGGGSRCGPQGGTLFTAPLPADFVVPGNHAGSPDGDTPNAAAAFLAADGHTLIQHQPFARCVAGGPATSHYLFPTEDLFGAGRTGSHGGSGLSALGGTVRLGELVPKDPVTGKGGVIPHALKLNIDSANFYGGFSGYRWPATKSDAGGAGYGGSIPECRQGSLLALRPDFNVDGLASGPGRIVGHCAQDYGMYVCDSSGWSIYNFPTERSPAGSVQDEFQRAWGFTLNAGVGANDWARDLAAIFANLHVVDNWDSTQWTVVSASGGLLGVGLGLPRVAWAPPLPAAPPAIMAGERPMALAETPRPALGYNPAGRSRLILCADCNTLVLRSQWADHEKAQHSSKVA